MLVSDVVEEIQEKLPNHLSPQSILRKITQIRDRLIRQSGSAQQQSETVCSGIDYNPGQSLYMPPCPAASISEVVFLQNDDVIRLPYRQFHNESLKPYYYVQAGLIGVVLPTGMESIKGLMKIFHLPVLPPLTLSDMDSSTGFDPDYDMLLVYGVLREIDSNFEDNYQQLLNEYKTVNNGYEKHSIDERW